MSKIIVLGGGIVGLSTAMLLDIHEPPTPAGPTRDKLLRMVA